MSKLEDNIRMNLKELCVNIRDWMDSTLDRDYWRAILNVALNLQVPYTMELVICDTFSFYNFHVIDILESKSVKRDRYQKQQKNWRYPCVTKLCEEVITVPRGPVVEKWISFPVHGFYIDPHYVTKRGHCVGDDCVPGKTMATF